MVFYPKLLGRLDARGWGWGCSVFIWGHGFRAKKWWIVGQKMAHSGPKSDVCRAEKWRTGQMQHWSVDDLHFQWLWEGPTYGLIIMWCSLSFSELVNNMIRICLILVLAVRWIPQDKRLKHIFAWQHINQHKNDPRTLSIWCILMSG